MNVTELHPAAGRREPFRRDRQKYVPSKSGCYAITTFEGRILYIGQAKDISVRMGNHLDNPQKTSLTRDGRAMFFYWLEADDLNSLERGWLNEHTLKEGERPVLNKSDAPAPIYLTS